jgi:hypothetical protein
MVFVQVGIDDALVLETKEDIYEMNNGCLCCTGRASATYSKFFFSLTSNGGKGGGRGGGAAERTAVSLIRLVCRCGLAGHSAPHIRLQLDTWTRSMT